MVKHGKKQKRNEDNDETFTQKKKTCKKGSKEDELDTDYVVDELGCENNILSDLEEEEGSNIDTKSKKSTTTPRGETQMHCLSIQRVKGIVKNVSFNALGQPIGEVATKMQSYIGYLARKEVKITYNSWKDVPKDVKDMIWDSVNMLFKVEPYWKKGCLKLASHKWRQFKSELTNEFVFQRISNPEELNKPPRTGIDQSVWSDFVISRLTEDFKEQRKKQQDKRKLNLYPHRLSRKGYAAHAVEIANEMSDDEEVNRARLWISARKTKEGNHEGEKLNSVVSKIGEYIQERKEGKLSVEGPEDGILSKALETAENTGRVRGIGGYVTPSVFFGLPRGGHREDKKRLIEQEKELLEAKKKNADLDARLKRLEQMVLKNESDKAIAEKAGSCSVINENPKNKNLVDREEKSPSFQELIDNEDVVVVKKTEALQGKLVSLVLESSMDVVANGTIIEDVGPDDCMCVSIDEAVDENALLPLPGPYKCIGDALGFHVKWPKHLINYKDGKPKRKAGKKTYSATMPKSLHMLHGYVEAVLGKDGNVHVNFAYDVFGNERTLYVHIEDITPFCELMPISYNCICVYIWHLYKKMMKEEIVDKFRFVDPIEIGRGPSTKADKKSQIEQMEKRARGLAKRLNGTLPNHLVIAPCNVGEHWILTVINPHKGVVHLLDPLYRRHHDETWKRVVELALKLFNMEIKKNLKRDPIWEIMKEAPLQPDSFQCGFFVMRYMREIIYDGSADMAKMRSQYFTRDTYSRAEIDEVRSEWAECVQEHIFT